MPSVSKVGKHFKDIKCLRASDNDRGEGLGPQIFMNLM